MDVSGCGWWMWLVDVAVVCVVVVGLPEVMCFVTEVIVAVDVIMFVVVVVVVVVEVVIGCCICWYCICWCCI